MNRIIMAIKRGGTWFIEHLGPVAIWVLIFLGLVNVFVLFDVHDALERITEHEKIIVNGYNVRLDEVKAMNEAQSKILEQIEKEEQIRLTGDSAYVEDYNKRSNLYKSWRDSKDLRDKAADERMQHILDTLNKLTTKMP